MTFIGAVDIPKRGVEDFRATLKDREAKLVNARRQRDIIQNDIRKATAVVDAGDKRAALELRGLNKANIEAGRLIVSIEREVAESAKHVTMAENQVSAAALKKAQADAAAVPHDKLFEVVCPDGVRKIRHRHHSLEALQRVLTPGYRVVAEVFAADGEDKGGFAASIGSAAKSTMMDGLLAAHGDILLAFLAHHGITKSDKTVVILPKNGRE